MKSGGDEVVITIKLADVPECSVTVRRSGEISTAELYSVLKLRTDVFFLEQNIDETELDWRDLEPTTVHYFVLDGRDAIACLRQAGIPVTHQRIEIARALFSAPVHLSADQIWAKVLEASPDVSRATVYNTLRLFATLLLTIIMINIVLNVIADLHRKLENQALTDPLTGAYNRRFMEKVLDALVTLAFHYPPRATFFRGELRQLFSLLGAVQGDLVGNEFFDFRCQPVIRAASADFDGLREFAVAHQVGAASLAHAGQLLNLGIAQEAIIFLSQGILNICVQCVDGHGTSPKRSHCPRVETKKRLGQ